jgi:prophage tail gpP-like protein
LTPPSHIVGDGEIHRFQSDDKDLKKAVEQKAGRMFGNACSYTLTLRGHRDKNGNLYTKNTLINVLAQGSAIYTDTKFLIKSLVLSRTVAGGDVTTMNIVLPEAYTGSIPGVLPWVG